jgi:hypothetical protein
LNIRIRQLAGNSRITIGGALATTMLIGSLGVAVPSSGASTVKLAAPSAFCTTLVSLSKVAPPASTNLSNYKKWIAGYLRYYQKLAQEAPASAKPVLNGLVTLMQNEGKTASVQALGAYVATHSKEWTNGWKAFANAAISCATSMYG